MLPVRDTIHPCQKYDLGGELLAPSTRDIASNARFHSSTVYICYLLIFVSLRVNSSALLDFGRRDRVILLEI